MMEKQVRYILLIPAVIMITVCVVMFLFGRGNENPMSFRDRNVEVEAQLTPTRSPGIQTAYPTLSSEVLANVLDTAVSAAPDLSRVIHVSAGPAPPPPATASLAREILDKARSRLEGIESLEVLGECTYVDEEEDSPYNSTMELTFKAPNLTQIHTWNGDQLNSHDFYCISDGVFEQRCGRFPKWQDECNVVRPADGNMNYPYAEVRLLLSGDEAELLGEERVGVTSKKKAETEPPEVVYDCYILRQGNHKMWIGKEDFLVHKGEIVDSDGWVVVGWKDLKYSVSKYGDVEYLLPSEYTAEYFGEKGQDPSRVLYRMRSIEVNPEIPRSMFFFRPTGSSDSYLLEDKTLIPNSRTDLNIQGRMK